MGRLNVAEEAIVAFVQALGKLAAQESLRLMVRDAGAIAPLVALLISGKGSVPGMAASVLRDLALQAGNRAAILESDGVAQLVKMLRNESKEIASEAADALRSLAKDNLHVCSVVRKSDGVKLLVQLIRGGLYSEAATQATGAISNIAEADHSSLEEIGDAGGVAAIVSLLTQGFDQNEQGGTRQRGANSAGSWAQSKAAAETSKALLELTRHKSCLKRMLDAGIIVHLVRLVLRAGASSPAAGHAGAILVLLLKNYEGEAMAQTLDALTAAKKDDSSLNDGHGWSHTFPELRTLLHAAAEKKLVAVEEGTSAQAIQAAIDLGRAVELPGQRLDDARANFDEVQAKRRREKMAAAAEERRIRKEEERQRQVELEAEQAPTAEESGRKATRKAALPTGLKVVNRLAQQRKAEAASSAEVLLQSEEQRHVAEMATVAAMQTMAPMLRDRMLRRMVREGHLVPGSTGVLAQYADSLGILTPSTALTPRTDGAIKLRSDAGEDMYDDGTTRQGERRAAKAQAARNDLASKAMARRIAQLQQSGLAGPPRAGDDDDDDFEDGSSYTGSSYSSEEENVAGAVNAPSGILKPSKVGGGGGRSGASTPGSATPPDGGSAKRGWLPNLFKSPRSHVPPPDLPAEDGGAAAADAEVPGKRRRRRRRKRRRPKENGGAGSLGQLPSQASTVSNPNAPSFMLPLFSKLALNSKDGTPLSVAHADATADPGQFETWRKRWDDKYARANARVRAAETRSMATAASTEPAHKPSKPSSSIPLARGGGGQDGAAFAKVVHAARSMTSVAHGAASSSGARCGPQPRHSPQGWEMLRERLPEAVERASRPAAPSRTSTSTGFSSQTYFV